MLSAYIVVMVLTLLNLFFSEGGITEYRKLHQYRDSLESNITDLKKINQGLKLDSQRLIHDSDDIKTKARELGYIGEDEGIILVGGYSNSQRNLYTMGKLLSREEGSEVPRLSFRIIAFFSGLIFYIISGLFSGKRTRDHDGRRPINVQ